MIGEIKYSGQIVAVMKGDTRVLVGHYVGDYNSGFIVAADPYDGNIKFFSKSDFKLVPPGSWQLEPRQFRRPL